MKEDSDSEEEILVYAEFEDSVNIDKYRAIHILGAAEKKPIIQLDETFFMGHYENALGTYMFFEQDDFIQGKDPLFDKYPDKGVKYVCKTRKLLNMEHAYVTPKEGKELNPLSQTKQTEDVEPVMFRDLQQATDAFKAYFISESKLTNIQNPDNIRIESANEKNPEVVRVQSSNEQCPVNIGIENINKQHSDSAIITSSIDQDTGISTEPSNERSSEDIRMESTSEQKLDSDRLHDEKIHWIERCSMESENIKINETMNGIVTSHQRGEIVARLFLVASNREHTNEKGLRHRSNKKQTLEDVLQEVNKRHVKIDKEEKKKNNTILYSVLEEFLKKMKSCDKLFSSLKPKLEYLGSYFEGLRVGHATEYDINIVLTLHVNYDKIKLDSGEIKGAYTVLKMPSEFRRLSKTPATAVKGFKDTELWCDPSHRLSVKRFRSWMQRVVDATLNTLPVENGMKILRIKNKSYQIAAKTSGPANTLTVIENSNNVIDVDLVPTLEFRLPQIPKTSGIDFKRVASTKINNYFVVPKPSADDFSWRLAFPFQERYYFHDKHNMKSAIKILKLLRDVQGFNKLASYYIKTIFLWEAVENTEDFWKNNSLTFLVLHMMKKLKECLENKTIKNFWCPEHNLIETIKTETCQNWCNRLSHIINVIDEKKKSDPNVVLQYLTAKNNST